MQGITTIGKAYECAESDRNFQLKDAARYGYNVGNAAHRALCRLKARKMLNTPIWNNRELIGYAKSAKGAERVIRSKLQTIPRGWKITVEMRKPMMIGLYGLESGFIYSIHP